MKVVLDTNVLVSGLLSPFGPCGEIVCMVSSGELTLCFDARILLEYAEVLARPKFQFNQEKVATLLNQVAFCGQTVAPSPLRQPLPDLDDEPFLEIALSSRSACLITGNRIHFPDDCCQGMTILSPSEFLAFYRRQT
jgi:putative PIN family toxin of toxin-antitoxin system